MFVFAAITSNGLNERGLITAGCSFLYLLIMMGLIVRAGFKAKKNNCIIIRLKVLSRSVSRSYRRYNWSHLIDSIISNGLKRWSSGRESLNWQRYLPISCASFDSIDIISKRRESLEDQWGIEDSESYCALMEHFLSGDHGANTFKANMEEAPEQVIALLNKFAVFPQTISLIALIIAPVNPRRS